MGGFARLYWRVRIETRLRIFNPPALLVSPAFIGGCGLKPTVSNLFTSDQESFARLYWRVRIETPPG